MRSLSPAPSLYSSLSAGGTAAAFLSSLSLSFSDARTGDRVDSAIRAAAVSETNVVCFIIRLPLVLIGRAKATAPVDDRARQRLPLQRICVDSVRGVTGGADRDAQRGREFVVLDARD